MFMLGQHGRSGPTGTPPKIGWNGGGVRSTKKPTISRTLLPHRRYSISKQRQKCTDFVFPTSVLHCNCFCPLWSLYTIAVWNLSHANKYECTIDQELTYAAAYVPGIRFVLTHQWWQHISAWNDVTHGRHVETWNYDIKSKIWLGSRCVFMWGQQQDE